jgi:hypothetical protein
MEKASLNNYDMMRLLGSVIASFFTAAKCNGVVVELDSHRYNVMVIDDIFTVCEDMYPNLEVGQLIAKK